MVMSIWRAIVRQGEVTVFEERDGRRCKAGSEVGSKGRRKAVGGEERYSGRSRYKIALLAEAGRQAKR